MLPVDSGRDTGARLALMCGLPKSGKTTYARRLQGRGWVRVCPDEIRRALHGRGHYPPAEPVVWANAELSVRALLIGGHRVVLDATNTTRHRRAPWLRLARELGVPACAYVLRTPKEECHRRNERSEEPVPPEVIDRMARQWEEVTEDGLEVHLVEG